MIYLKITPLAENDLKHIGRYTYKNWGKKKRDQYLHEIDSKLRDIASNPLIGKNRNELFNNCRSLVAKSHVIFYRKKENNIEILRILHKSMDVDPLIKSGMTMKEVRG